MYISRLYRVAILGIHNPVRLIYHIACLVSIEVVSKLWNRGPIAFKSALRRVHQCRCRPCLWTGRSLRDRLLYL